MGELAALIAPRKLLLVTGEKDPIFPIDGTRKIYATIEKIYEKEGVKDNCELLVTPREHYFCKDLVFGKIGR